MKLEQVLETGPRLIAKALRCLSEVNCSAEPISYKTFKVAYSLHSNFVNDVILYLKADHLTLRRIHPVVRSHTDFYIHKPTMIPIMAVAAVLSSHCSEKFTVIGQTASFDLHGDDGPAAFYISFQDEQIEWVFEYITETSGTVTTFDELLAIFKDSLNSLIDLEDE